MRVFCVAALLASSALAQSHPRWWTYVPADSTALVGFDWNSLKRSLFGGLFGFLPTGAAGKAKESLSFGGVKLPDLPCLHEAGRVLLASPQEIALAPAGSCPQATLHAQASRAGMKAIVYRGIQIWSASAPGISVAATSDGALLVGPRKVLQAAIDRNQSPDRALSPLLGRAAQLAASSELWIVANTFPKQLEEVLPEIGGELDSIAAGISFANGIDLICGIEARTPAAAQTIAAKLRSLIPELPEVTQGLNITTNGRLVDVSLSVPRAELEASMRGAFQAVAQAAGNNGAAPVPPAPKRAEPPGPPEKQVIRIFGLDEGVREIPVKPPKN